MNILGIVAEYDPFHNGHLYHLSEAKRRSEADFTYIVLSPCLKQRGTLSLLSPADRARCALEAGADAVFALPVLWAVRDAEHYALGAVSLLASLGATHLAFGAETDAFPLLQKAADMLEAPSSRLEAVLRSHLSEGRGYPAALSAAVSALLPEAGQLLSQPNNTLAICYLRAIRQRYLSLKPVLIPRAGSYHADRIDLSSPSSSAICSALRRGSWADALSAVPPYTGSLLRGRFLAGSVPDAAVFDAILLSRLRSMSRKEYAALPDVSEGLEQALEEAAFSAPGRESLLSRLSGRRYPAARISRLCAYALLRIQRADLAGLSLPDSALLLGLRKNVAMTGLWKSLPFPVVTSFTEWKKTAHPADLASWSLWAQCCRLPSTLPFTEKIVTLG